MEEHFTCLVGLKNESEDIMFARNAGTRYKKPEDQAHEVYGFKKPPTPSFLLWQSYKPTLNVIAWKDTFAACKWFYTIQYNSVFFPFGKHLFQNWHNVNSVVKYTPKLSDVCVP
jgi:hypothetical protein